MVKRTRRDYMYNLLEKNPNWKVADIACATSGWKYADVFVDVVDHSEYYKRKYGDSKKFVVGNVEDSIFKDKEFDFVIASHILEHVSNPTKFCNELVRISKRGYIEIPTPLWDNLATGPVQTQYGHKWWVTFDDVDGKIEFNKKINVVNSVLSGREHNKHMMFFRDSIVTQLYWEDNIQLEFLNGIFNYSDGRDYNDTYDSNEIKDWDSRFIFEFGKLK